ncbi:MAG: hypothetical protein ACP5RT_02990 [Candidatus Micrarchaeia archaeon]
MKKKLIYSGLLLILFSIFVSYNVSSAIFQIPKYISTQFIISPNMSVASQIFISTSNITTVVYNSTEPINFYLINKNAYERLEGIPANKIQFNISGVYEVLLNSKSGAFESMMEFNKSKNLVVYNVSSISNGTYYLLFSNVGNSTANVFVMYAVQKSNENYQDLFSFGSISAILLLAGVTLVIYGIMGRNEKEKNKEEIKVKMKLKRKSRKSV